MPSALERLLLQPVALIAIPYSVPKNQYNTAIMHTTKMSAVPTVFIISAEAFPAVTNLDERTRGYLSTLTGAFALPLMSRYTE